MAPRNFLREYETVIADSPMRNALFNRPFKQIRRRTENLLDSITGGSVAPEVAQEKLREEERDRGLTCRYCRVIYANEAGLNKHYDMFPLHFTAERQKKQPGESTIASTSSSPQLSPSSPMPKALPEQTRRSHPVTAAAATGGASPNAASSVDRRNSLKYSRARSTPNLKPGDAVPSSRPAPTVPVLAPARIDDLAPAFHSHLQIGNRSPQLPSSHVSSGTASPNLNIFDDPVPVDNVRSDDHYATFDHFERRFASDFYLPSHSAPIYDSMSSPYDAAHPMGASSQNHFANAPLVPTAVAPHAAAMSPSHDFASRFTTIGRSGVAPPSPARQTVVASSPKRDLAAERNYQQGVQSAAKYAVRPNGEGDGMIPGPNQARRQASEGAIHGSIGPSSFGGVVRAIVATGATGAGGAAVMPERVRPVRPSASESLQPRLGGDVEQQRRPSPARKPVPRLDALDSPPPAPKKAEKKTEEKPVQPVKTGTTSFTPAEETNAPGTTSGPPSPARSRSSTNPFLNRDFMRNVPNILKTPPLSPSSPWTNGSASPGNPFMQLPDEGDDVQYFDAVDAPPQTPADELRATLPTKGAQAERPFTVSRATGVPF